MATPGTGDLGGAASATGDAAGPATCDEVTCLDGGCDEWLCRRQAAALSTVSLGVGPGPRPKRAQTWVDSPAARPQSDPDVPDALGAGFTHTAYADSGFVDQRAGAFEANGRADMLPPCSVLAELTGQALDAGLHRLTDDELVGVMRAARRVASWQAAVELAAVAELAGRRIDSSPADAPGPRPQERAAAEIGAALTLTGQAAAVLTDLAAAVGRLDTVAQGLAEGWIDVPKARVFAAELACLDSQLMADCIATRLMPAAPSLTTTQIRARLRRAVLQADPAAVRRRQDKARADARVELWSESSGNAGLAGRELPLAAAISADKHLTAVAAAMLKAGTAHGNLDQARALALVGLLCGESVEDLVRSAVVAAKPGSEPAARGTGSVHLTLPLSSWLGLAETAGTIAGYGPADSRTCRELATSLANRPATRWCVTITNTAGHALGHACARSGPPGSDRAGPGPPGGGAGLARWLAGLPVSWLETGSCGHQRQRDGYQPGRALAHLIKIRNPTCTAPGCRRPAHACDIDHVVPYGQGGRTCECNCGPLCRFHHQCKQAEGWRLRQPAPGVFSWTMPHGRSYRTVPEPYPV